MRNQLLWGAAAIALVAPAGAMAQETTSVIRGTVTSGGAPVAGATITIVNVPSGTTTTATTNNAGGFNASGLRPGGPYTVTISAPGYAEQQVTDINTVVSQVYTLPVELTAADAGGADIVVTADTIRGAGSSSEGPQTVLTKAQIERVASVNRDIRDLARRSPFARIEDTSGGGRSVSFAGINPRFNRFSIDGVQVGDNFGLNPDANPTRRGPVPLDSIGQFSVSVAPYDIRQGNFTGGAIDAVLLSGTNRLHGTGFYSQNTDGLSGEKIGDDIDTNLDYKSESYGATLSGPIIPDKLFFMISAERTKQGNPFNNGIQAEGFGTPVPGLTRAQITAVQGIAQGTYGYAAGDLLTTSPDIDEKIVGKIDWNITDGQRLSLSYINAYDTNQTVGNVSTGQSSPGIGLSSNGYGATELLRAGIVQLNSDWTDIFSTEARFLYKSYERTRPPLGQGGFGQFSVCTDQTAGSAVGSPAGTTNDTLYTCGTNNPNLFFGVENSTQSNQFYTDTYGGSFVARLNLNGHDLRLLTEYNKVRIFNVFFQNTLGSFYFDSLADLTARNANQVIIGNALTGDPNDTAADFTYSQWTFGIQDNWRVTDRLNINAGVRFDLYDQTDRPALNLGYLNRYNEPNNKNLKGLSVFEPRIGFDWEPIDDLTFRGGFGVFAGGTPDVYIANSFQNSGVGSVSGLTIRRTADGRFTVGSDTNFATGALATAAATVLNGVTGQLNADAVRTLLASAGGANNAGNTATVNSLDDDFRIPSVRKATLSVDWEPKNLLGGGWRLGADYYYSDTENQVYFTDIRSVPSGTLPDGRPRYIGLLNSTLNDIQVTNTGKGRSHIGVVRVEKTFDFGLNASFAYSVQDVKDASPATSSTAGSNYGNGAFYDGRGAAYGTANDQVAWSFKYGLGLDRAFFGNARTRIQLFGETQAGRPYSYTMEDAGSSTRSAVFGVTGRDDRFLLYVPNSGTDALVSYDSTATQDALENLIDKTKLKNFRGKIAPRNLGRARAYTRIDLHAEQEVPTGLFGATVSVFADIENLPNLLNKDWGGFRQALFPYVEDVVRVQCLNVAVPTGTAPGTGVVNTVPTQTCAQYRYSGFVEPNENTVETRPSLYLIRLGARIRF